MMNSSIFRSPITKPVLDKEKPEIIEPNFLKKISQIWSNPLTITDQSDKLRT